MTNTHAAWLTSQGPRQVLRGPEGESRGYACSGLFGCCAWSWLTRLECCPRVLSGAYRCCTPGQRRIARAGRIAFEQQKESTPDACRGVVGVGDIWGNGLTDMSPCGTMAMLFGSLEFRGLRRVGSWAALLEGGLGVCFVLD
jgi:hypothetical protein